MCTTYKCEDLSVFHGLIDYICLQIDLKTGDMLSVEVYSQVSYHVCRLVFRIRTDFNCFISVVLSPFAMCGVCATCSPLCVLASAITVNCFPVPIVYKYGYFPGWLSV